MNRRFLVLGAALLSAIPLLVSEPVRADDPAAKHDMKPLPKIDQAFLNGLIGDWKVNTEGEGPKGKMSGKGTAKFTRALGDSAILEDYESDVMGGFSGHGVFKLSADGKTARAWWFDSFNPEPVLLTGSLTDTLADLSGTCPEGTIRIQWTKVDGGYDFAAAINGQPRHKDEYRKSSPQ